MFDDKPDHDRYRGRVRSVRAAVLVAIPLACLGFLLAGCGSGSKPPSVASLGTTGASGASSSASSSSSAGGAFPIGASMSMNVGTGEGGVQYSACMRSHGVPDYPDPNGQGAITIRISASLNPNSPQFQKAQAGCRHLIPAGSEARKTLSSGQRQQIQERALAFSSCMRSHGVPDYPDPTFSNGGVRQSSGSSVDANSPAFQAAQKTCQSQTTPSP